MLQELPVTHRTTEPRRRWFADEYFDLVVWTSKSAIVAFDLCYDKPRFERALTWSREHGWGHFRVDSGEDTPVKNRTPILVSDGLFPKAQVLAHLTVRAFVLTKLQEFVS